MASDDKKTGSTVLKNETSGKTEVTTKKKEEGRTSDKLTADQSKTEGSGKESDAPSGYSRGEGQKPVSKAYKDNWNAIYAKKKN